MPDKSDEILSAIADLNGCVQRIDERTESHTAQLKGIHTTIGSLRERAAASETEIGHLKGQVSKKSSALGAVAGGGMFGILAALKAFFAPGN